MSDPASTSRAQAVGWLAAELQKPMRWDGLTALGRALAARLPGLDAAPAEPPLALRQKLLDSVPPPADAAALSRRAGLRAMVLLIDMAALGEAQGLAVALDEVSALPDGPAILGALARFLDAAGLGRGLSPDELGALGGRLQRSGAERMDLLLAAFALLGLSPTAPYPARRNAFHEVVAPRLRAAAAAGDADLMLSVEAFAYNAYFKTVETPEHHRETLCVLEDAYAQLPAAPRPAAPPLSPDAPPRIVFMIFNGAILAHTEVLLAFLAGIARLERPILEPVVFIYGVTDGGELGRRLDGMGVRWEAFGQRRPHTYEDLFGRVRERIAAIEAHAAVLVSMPLHLGYLCRRPVAPVQIWLSLKFPLPNFEGLDGRVFCRSLLDRRIMIEGRLWRGGPLAITPPDPPDPAAVEAIRARYPSMRLLGTVAREEKIANAAYLDAVVGVLARHPDTCFLWTGRNPLPEIQQAFERGGVAERCHFVGWVDPAPYIMAFDLQIETYPLTGVVFGWGMSWGKPVLSVGSLGFVGTYLEPILTGAVPAEPEEIARIESIFAPVRGRLPGLWAPTPAEIGDFADLLLGDPGLMAALGRAQQAYVRRYLMDEVGAAAAQARHYADIVRETLAGRAA